MSQLSEGNRRPPFKYLLCKWQKGFSEGEARTVAIGGNPRVSGMRLSGTGKTTPQAQGRAHGHLVLLVWEPSLPCRAWAPAWGLWVTVPVKGSQGDPSDSWSSRKMIWGPYPPSPPLALVPLLRNPNISTQCRTPDQACRLCPQGDSRIEMSLSALTVPWPPPNVTLAEPSPSWGFQWREELRATLGTSFTLS